MAMLHINIELELLHEISLIRPIKQPQHDSTALSLLLARQLGAFQHNFLVLGDYSAQYPASLSPDTTAHRLNILIFTFLHTVHQICIDEIGNYNKVQSGEYVTMWL